jgi:hypothetical protein
MDARWFPHALNGEYPMTSDLEHFRDLHLSIVEAFDKDKTAIQFLRDDGEGGFTAGIYRMAREIERLRDKCGEPQERPADWQEVEDVEVDAEIDAILAARATPLLTE